MLVMLASQSNSNVQPSVGCPESLMIRIAACPPPCHSFVKENVAPNVEEAQNNKPQKAAAINFKFEILSGGGVDCLV